MRWSKLKNLVEERFAPSIRWRVAIHSTRYGNCACGRAWLTLDGVEIANFCTRAAGNMNARQAYQPSAESLANFARMPVGYGELSRQDAYAACWAFVHDLSIEQALVDADPLIQTLAVLDARVGRKRLAVVQLGELHPLARKLYEVRAIAEAHSQQPDSA